MGWQSVGERWWWCRCGCPFDSAPVGLGFWAIIPKPNCGGTVLGALLGIGG